MPSVKKLLSAILSAALLLGLAACGEKEPAAFDPAADAQTLLSSGAFSDAASLFEITTDVACSLFGLDAATVESCAAYTSGSVTAEELFILAFSDEQQAEAFTTTLGYYLEDKTESLRDYLPDEVPKLSGAILERRKNSVLFAVAADYAPIKAFLEG